MDWHSIWFIILFGAVLSRLRRALFWGYHCRRKDCLGRNNHGLGLVDLWLFFFFSPSKISWPKRVYVCFFIQMKAKGDDGEKAQGSLDHNVHMIWIAVLFLKVHKVWTAVSFLNVFNAAEISHRRVLFSRSFIKTSYAYFSQKGKK